jgi:hypothetical protein
MPTFAFIGVTKWVWNQSFAVSKLPKLVFCCYFLQPGVCDICEKPLASMRTMKRHRLTHMSIENRSFECKVCFKFYVSEMALKVHQREHSADGRSFICDICGLGYRTTSGLSVNMRRNIMVGLKKNIFLLLFRITGKHIVQNQLSSAISVQRLIAVAPSYTITKSFIMREEMRFINVEYAIKFTQIR